MSNDQTVLETSDLSVAYRGGATTVAGVSFSVERNQTIAIVGQSGSGKTTTINALLRLLPRNATVRGQALFEGHDLLRLRRSTLKQVLRSSVGFVPQDPVNSLNPVRRIGVQIEEALHLVHPRGDATRPSVNDVLARVGIPHPERVAHLYPNQLSGGMLQRVLVGIAVVGSPKLLVADEPTSALDVSVQRHILDLLDDLKSELGLSLVLVTHDLSLARERADRVLVLEGGKVVESGLVATVLRAPKAAFTRQLLGDVPAFAPDKYAGLKSERAVRDDAAVELRNIRRQFGSGEQGVVALDDLSLTVRRGSTHALVGESGSGKTTAARIILGLERADAGEVVVAGKTLDIRDRQSVRAARRHLQIVYQSPYSSLNPRWKVNRLIREPLDRYEIGTPDQRRRRVEGLLERVGLSSRDGNGTTEVLSGGQRQRVAIARALALEPDVVVLDEPTSALDVTVQAQILDLLMEMQRDLGVSYLFVSHDLSIVRQIADYVTVLKDGKVMEAGTVGAIFGSPQSDYTRYLIESVPGYDQAERALS